MAVALSTTSQLVRGIIRQGHLHSSAIGNRWTTDLDPLCRLPSGVLALARLVLHRRWVEQARAASGGAGPDIMYESVGGSVTKACLEALAPLGELVIYGALNIQSFQFGVPELIGVIFKNQSLTGFALPMLVTPGGLKADLAELFDLAVRGELKVTIGGTHPLERATEAHRALEGRGTTGKLVLVP